MQFNIEQWHLLITVAIISAIYQAKLYRQNAECTSRKCLGNTSETSVPSPAATTTLQADTVCIRPFLNRQALVYVLFCIPECNTHLATTAI